MSITRSILGGAGLVATLAAGAQPPAAATQPGSSPSAAVPTGYLVVANQQSADASIVTLPAGTERRVAVGTGPHEAAIAADGRWGVVTVYGNRESVGAQLALIDLASGTLVRHVELGEYTRPHAAVPLPGPGRRVLVTSETTGNVAIVDLDAGRVEAAIPTEAAGSHMVVVTADGGRAFTANMRDGSVSEIDVGARRFVREIPVGQQATEGVAVTPDGREVWVGSNASGLVSIVDTREGRVVATVSGFRMPYRLAIASDGRTAAVVDPQSGSLHLVDVASREVTAAVAFDASPRGVVFSPDGRTAFVTTVTQDGAGAVVAVDVASREIVGRYAVGIAPDGVAFQPATTER